MGPASSSPITVVAAWVAARALSPATRTPASAPPFSCMRRYGTMSAMVELTPPAGGEVVVVRRRPGPHRAVYHRVRPRAVGRVEVVAVAEDGRIHAKRRQHPRAYESLPRLTRGPRGALGGGGRQGVLVGVGPCLL